MGTLHMPVELVKQHAGRKGLWVTDMQGLRQSWKRSARGQPQRGAEGSADLISTISTAKEERPSVGASAEKVRSMKASV